MTKYDLHTHTTYSDGEYDIAGNVNKAIEVGLDGIAVTDHDNVDSWKEIDQKAFKIDVIKGVELSTYYKGESVHVLGYYMNDDGDYEELDEFLKDVREKRKERVYKIIELLKPLGIEVTYEDIIKFADGAVARPHIAKAIMEKYPERNYTIDYIFNHFIGDGCPAYVKVFNFETEDAIKLLHDNHCIVVLAHPLLLKRVSYKELLTLDFDGIEVMYPYQHKDYKTIRKGISGKNLIITGGSDFHGYGNKERSSVGKAYVEGEELKKFLKRVNKQ